MSVEILQSASVTTYSAKFSASHTTMVPTLVRVSSDPSLPTGSLVSVDYDPNVALDAPALVVDRGRVRELRPAVMRNGGRTRATVTMPASIGIGDEALELALPLSVRDVYPSENSGRPADVLFNISAPDGSFSRHMTLSRTADLEPVQPWGAEVAAGWAVTSVRDSGHERTYRYPSVVRVTGVGPNPVPAGMTVSVEADARVLMVTQVSAMDVDGDTVPPAHYQVATHTADGVARTTILFGPSLAPGRSLNIELEPHVREDAALGAGIVFARAFAAAPSTASRPERSTGRRMAIAVSDSGEPVASSDAEGTI